MPGPQRLFVHVGVGTVARDNTHGLGPQRSRTRGDCNGHYIIVARAHTFEALALQCCVFASFQTDRSRPSCIDAMIFDKVSMLVQETIGKKKETKENKKNPNPLFVHDAD